VECLSCPEGCSALEVPDSIITEKLGVRESEAYAPEKLPEPPGEADPSELLGIARRSMLAIMPETSPAVARWYLRDASFALFMSRAAEGIRKSGSADLLDHYSAVMRGRIDAGALERLTSTLDNLREAVPARDAAKVHASRTKAVFSILRAGKIGYGLSDGARG